MMISKPVFVNHALMMNNHLSRYNSTMNQTDYLYDRPEMHDKYNSMN